MYEIDRETLNYPVIFFCNLQNQAEQFDKSPKNQT